LAFVPVISSLKQTTSSWGLPLTYSVYELQEPLLLELIPKTIICSYNPSKIVFWSQDIGIQMWCKVLNPFPKATVPPHAMEVLGGEEAQLLIILNLGTNGG
jgi:hypothetical protein